VRLPVLCPQEYQGMDMVVVPCSRAACGNWDRQGSRCVVTTGCEHLPVTGDRPACPIEHQCQHGIQAAPDLCAVRLRGLVCESALVAGGLSPEDAANHPLSFHAYTVASPEEWAEREQEREVVDS